MKTTVLYVGSSLLAPLRRAEDEINRRHGAGLRVAAHNFGAPLSEGEWAEVERDLAGSEVVFVIHVTDGENAARLLPLLRSFEARHRAVVVINCMPELMRRTRMGKLRFGGAREDGDEESAKADEGSGVASEKTKGAGVKASGADALEGGFNGIKGSGGTGVKEGGEGRARRLVKSVGAWMGEQARGRRGGSGSRHTQYLKLVERVPALLRFVPGAGRLRDVKNYLYLFCYFLQPTPANVSSMLLYALKHYAGDEHLSKVEVPPPETVPAVGIYHPDAPSIFETFEAYRRWHERRARRARLPPLVPANTVGLLLMRTNVVSGTRKHYDGLIRAVEREGLAALPVISTFMDNRDACSRFFVDDGGKTERRGDGETGRRRERETERRGDGETESHSKTRPVAPSPRHPVSKSRVSQIVSLTGFSFVGGPAMNDSEAAVGFLQELNVPLRSAVSLDVQTVEAWRESWTGLNPVQAGMQVAIPEIDGATEPFVFGGMTAEGFEPVAVEERCRRLARRLRRWNQLQNAERSLVKLALVLFCFPPNKGNIGTAADLDVFPSVQEILCRLRAEGYAVEVPSDAERLREMLLGGNSERFGAVANVAYRMTVEEYLNLCPYAAEIEKEWGAAPGSLGTFGRELLIQGVQLGNVFVAVQPTFGYEGDPLRLLMSRGGAPHHGFAALYTYLEKIFRADAVVHTGTHGALEFMPGKQVGLSGECWPDRLIGELPHVYIYSVNNPSEGSIARRRSYAGLVSYLTPPIEDAGVYRELASLKEVLLAYRQSADEQEREQLYAIIEEKARSLHFARA
ncbi:MAG: cobaltochelatase subunit CobN [Acidobacteriota bacterium]|nr:cobaltochelatase subunit CobN [Acidobacteriota bacterium]MDQ5836602.1 cobaltochelatase subunit CobN [Acidobacteriota bacterium]